MDLFSQFFQENQKKFLSFAYSYTRNKAAAEDILMEAMASLWENREKMGKRFQPACIAAYYHQKQITQLS